MSATTQMAGDWRHYAACRDVDSELFQPSAESGRVLAAQVVAAKAVCGRCPVREACLAFALVMLPHGIAGGLTETERSALRHRTAAVAQAGDSADRAGSRVGAA